MVCGDVIRICCGRIQRDNNGGCVFRVGVERPFRPPLAFQPPSSASLVHPHVSLHCRSVREVQLHLLPGGHRGPTCQVHRVLRIRPLLAGGSTVRTTMLNHVTASPLPLRVLFRFATSLSLPSLCFSPFFPPVRSSYLVLLAWTRRSPSVALAHVFLCFSPYISYPPSLFFHLSFHSRSMNETFIVKRGLADILNCDAYVISIL